MCGRYTVIDDDAVAELRQIIPGFRSHISTGQLAQPRTALPGSAAPILTQHGDFMMADWGFTKWDSKGIVFNARSETLTSSGFFSWHLPYGRCIAPAKEYFEWMTDAEDSKAKIKHRIFAEDHRPLFLGALMRPANNRFQFTVITRAASAQISHIHHRMPLIFSASDAELWLKAQFDASLLRKGIGNMAYEPVS